MHRFFVRALCLATVLIAMSCSGKNDPAPPETAPAPDQTAPPGEADSQTTVTKSAQDAPGSQSPTADAAVVEPPSSLSESTAALSSEQRTLVAITTADIDCAKKRRPSAEVMALLNGRLQQHKWSQKDFALWSAELLDHNAAAKTAYDNRMKTCPPETVSPETREKVEKVYVELMCIGKRGLAHREWARRAATVYQKHGLGAQEYTTAMRTLITDRKYQKTLIERIHATCPGPIKQPDPVKKAPKISGSFRGKGTGLRGFAVQIQVKIKDGVVKKAIMRVDDANWPLQGTIRNNKITLAGKRGNDSLVLRGAVKSNLLLGNFSGFIGGAKQQGSWTASKR